jgi:hypothetical protein
MQCSSRGRIINTLEKVGLRLFSTLMLEMDMRVSIDVNHSAVVPRLSISRKFRPMARLRLNQHEDRADSDQDER